MARLVRLSPNSLLCAILFILSFYQPAGADATSLQTDFRQISRVAACGQFYSGTRVLSAPLQTGRVSFPLSRDCELDLQPVSTQISGSRDSD